MADATVGQAPGSPGEAREPKASTAETIRQRVLAAVENLVNLRVTTVVGGVQAIDVDEFHRVTTLRLQPGEQSVASSSIDMVLGDSSTIVSPIFVQDAAFQKLHADARAQAEEVRKNTIDMLVKVYKELADKLGL